MATLADLFASTQAPNVNQLRVQPVAYQRGGSRLGKAVGTVGDILAAIGGRNPVYESTMQGRENAYNQSMKEQQFQNVFRNFVENPNDPMVQANLAEVNPEAFLKVAPQNKALGNRVVRMGPLGTPEVVVEAPVEPVEAPRLNAGFPGLIEARARYADGSPEANLLDQRIAAEIQKNQRLAAGPAPRATSGGSAPNKPAKALTPTQQEKADTQNKSRTQAMTLVNKLAGLYRRLESLGAAPGSGATTAANIRARVMASGPGQVVGQARGSDSQAIINEINATQALLLPFYAQALGLGTKSFDTPAEKEQLLQAFGAVTGRTDANISSLGSVAEAFGGKVSDPGQGAFKVRSRRPAGGQ